MVVTVPARASGGPVRWRLSRLDLDRDNRTGSSVELVQPPDPFDSARTGLSDRGVYAATLEERTDDIRTVIGCRPKRACRRIRVLRRRLHGLRLRRHVSGPDPRVAALGPPCLAGSVASTTYSWGFEPGEHDQIIAELGRTRDAVHAYLSGKGARDRQTRRLISSRKLSATSRPRRARPRWLRSCSPHAPRFVRDIRGRASTIRGPDPRPEPDQRPRGGPPSSRRRAMATGSAGSRLPSMRTLALRSSPFVTFGAAGAILSAIDESHGWECPPVRVRIDPHDRALHRHGRDCRRSLSRLPSGTRLGRPARRPPPPGPCRVGLDCRGREVDTAGDGTFASFDGPARAGTARRRSARHSGPAGHRDARAGVHTGASASASATTSAASPFHGGTDRCPCRTIGTDPRLLRR